MILIIADVLTSATPRTFQEPTVLLVLLETIVCKESALLNYPKNPPLMEDGEVGVSLGHVLEHVEEEYKFQVDNATVQLLEMVENIALDRDFNFEVVKHKLALPADLVEKKILEPNSAPRTMVNAFLVWEFASPLNGFQNMLTCTQKIDAS